MRLGVRGAFWEDADAFAYLKGYGISTVVEVCPPSHPTRRSGEQVCGRYGERRLTFECTLEQELIVLVFTVDRCSGQHNVLCELILHVVEVGRVRDAPMLPAFRSSAPTAGFLNSESLTLPGQLQRRDRVHESRSGRTQ